MIDSKRSPVNEKRIKGGKGKEYTKQTHNEIVPINHFT